ncbi:MAG: hypothetical protein ABW220_13835 [Burkholderiaceae bacterium]
MQHLPTRRQVACGLAREWSVPAGAEISRSALAPDNFWILLDGGWQVEQGAVVAKASNADSGKWYGGTAMQGLGIAPTRLVATAPSYVMNIRQAHLDDMVDKHGYAPVERQLQRGIRFYRNTFK